MVLVALDAKDTNVNDDWLVTISLPFPFPQNKHTHTHIPQH